MKVLLLSVKPPYDFTTKEGQHLSGVKIVFATSLLNGKGNGLSIVEKNLPTSFCPQLDSLKNVPSVVDFQSEFTYSATGKLIERPTSIKFVSDAKLEHFMLGIF